MNKYNVINNPSIISFKNTQELRELVGTIEMIKIAEKEYNPDKEQYTYILTNRDTIIIKDADKHTIMLHKSLEGNLYSPIVNENEDNDSLDIEYVGFRLANDL